MLLHVNVSIEMVQGAVALLAVLPIADVQALDLIEPPAWSLLGVYTGDGHERIRGLAIRAKSSIALDQLSIMKPCR